jgi:PRTRC genetic system protein E
MLTEIAMFQSLKPLLEERSIHLMLSLNSDGLINLFVQPIKRNDKEDDAFTVPFRVVRDAADLDQNLADLIRQWIERRAAIVTPLGNELAAFEKQQQDAAAAAKKKVADKAKKPGATGTPSSTAGKPTAKASPSLVTPPAAPSLFDAPATAEPAPNAADDDEDDEQDAPASLVADAAPASEPTPTPVTPEAAPAPATDPAKALASALATAAAVAPAPIASAVVTDHAIPSLF